MRKDYVNSRPSDLHKSQMQSLRIFWNPSLWLRENYDLEKDFP
jgi:hypothetical protein